MSVANVLKSEQLTVSDSAAHKIYELLREEDNFDLYLRVYIEGGGCSGFQYGFTFDDVVQDDDFVAIKHVEDEDEGGSDVSLVIDSMSFQYLLGAEIDYKDDLDGARFIIRNPNASTTCGCGSSFSI